jgi:hypothetical protein
MKLILTSTGGTLFSLVNPEQESVVTLDIEQPGSGLIPVRITASVHPIQESGGVFPSTSLPASPL